MLKSEANVEDFMMQEHKGEIDLQIDFSDLASKEFVAGYFKKLSELEKLK
jgi:hypothetical protein